MSKLNQVQIATAKRLLKDHPNEKQIFVKVENGHMYFKKEAALISVGDDESKLEKITRDTADKKDDQSESKTGTPDTTWKFDELKAYAEQKGVILEPSDKSKDAVLAKIKAATESKP